jgi:hypothetical protein
MNELEYRESLTSILTVLIGLFYITNSNLPITLHILLTFIFYITNLWFLVTWTHLFFKSSHVNIIRFIAKVLGRFVCLGKVVEKTGKVEPSKSMV